MSQILDQLPRNSVIWLIFGVFSACAPHFFYMPVWVGVIALVCIGWRWWIHVRAVNFPRLPVKLILITTGSIAVYRHFGTLVGPEAGVAMLVIAFAFKLLESATRRDAFIIIILAYFVMATSFLYSRNLLMTAGVFLAAFLITAALVGINQSPYSNRVGRTLKKSAALLLQSVPLMIVLFFLVPRVSPLWSVDFERKTARTGMTDTMAPGEISALSQSAELAFRVEFRGRIPEKKHLYWRGMTLNYFDGNRWTPGYLFSDFSRTVQFGGQSYHWYEEMISSRKTSERLSYTIFMEPTNQHWLFALPVAFSPEKTIGFGRDYRLVSKEPLISTMVFSVESYPAMVMDPTLDEAVRKAALQLPFERNPRARRLAQQLRSETGSDREFVNRVLDYFRNNDFYYTLSPPPLAGDKVDDFLFRSRRGFCEHYAQAFVVLMRAGSVPARVVVGYQGGEVHPSGYVLVHQYDAHAWAEVWLPGKGWTRVDPTAAIAPERIELGLESALAGSDEFLEGNLLAMARYPWLSRLRLSLDYADYLWTKWVVGYDQQTQIALLTRWLGEFSIKRLAMTLAILIAVILGLFSLFYLWKYRPVFQDPVVRAWYQWCRRWQDKGFAIAPESGVSAVIEVLKNQTTDTRYRDELDSLARELNHYWYSGHANPADAELLLKRLRQFKPPAVFQKR